MQVVLPYARYLISGVPRRFGAEPEPVEIGPGPEGGHGLLLRSSQPDTPPLQLNLDDAELADLVRALDQLRLDPRLQLPLELPQPLPLRRIGESPGHVCAIRRSRARLPGCYARR